MSNQNVTALRSGGPSDPIFAAIEKFRTAQRSYEATKEADDTLEAAFIAACHELSKVVPTTRAGLIALLDVVLRENYIFPANGRDPDQRFVQTVARSVRIMAV